MDIKSKRKHFQTNQNRRTGYRRNILLLLQRNLTVFIFQSSTQNMSSDCRRYQGCKDQKHTGFTETDLSLICFKSIYSEDSSFVILIR